MTSRKTNILTCQYKLCQFSVARSHRIRDLGVRLDSKLNFHKHVSYTFSECMKLLGIVGSITFCFSSFNVFILRVHFILVTTKPEYAYVVCNFVTSTDDKPKLSSCVLVVFCCS
jgi:hypothetical protein